VQRDSEPGVRAPPLEARERHRIAVLLIERGFARDARVHRHAFRMARARGISVVRDARQERRSLLRPRHRPAHRQDRALQDARTMPGEASHAADAIALHAVRVAQSELALGQFDLTVEDRPLSHRAARLRPGVQPIRWPALLESRGHAPQALRRRDEERLARDDECHRRLQRGADAQLERGVGRLLGADGGNTCNQDQEED